MATSSSTTSVTNFPDLEVVEVAVPFHKWYHHYWKRWRKIRDCLDGEDTLKAKQTEYLPAPGGQGADDYKEYLERATFFNVSDRTLKSLVGSVFRKDPIVTPDDETNPINSRIVTDDGKTFRDFAYQLTSETVAMGRVGVLIDKPPAPLSGPAYFVTYKAEDIINWRRKRLPDGTMQTDQVIVRESYEHIPAGGLGTEIRYRYRVLELDERGFYRQRILDPITQSQGSGGSLGMARPQGSEGAPKSGKFVVQIVYPTMNDEFLTTIPFWFIGPYETTPEVQKAPLQDVVTLNLSHYRSYAELEHGRHYTAMPTYYATGNPDEDVEYKIGPPNVWIIQPEDKVGVIEFNGQGLIFLENATQQKEQQMALIGGRLMGNQRRMAGEAEIALQLRERGDNAILTNVAIIMDRVLSEMLIFASQWDGRKKNYTVEVNKDFTEGEITARELRVLQQLWESGLYPVSGLYHVYRTAQVIPSDMTLQEFKDLLQLNGDEVPAVPREPKPGTVQLRGTVPQPDNTPRE